MRRQTPTASFPIEIATFFVSLIFSFCHESIAKSFPGIRFSAGRRMLPGWTPAVSGTLSLISANVQYFSVLKAKTGQNLYRARR
ncbi:hypothetical protein JCM10003_3208 [Bacteroides pyogenes JCM 10003]|nr:hypothetical protein JCM10003_3208 [Bacteroides pyogenes JCM 10003]